MSEQVVMQETERTIEIVLERKGLGIEQGQAAPGITVDFGTITAPAAQADWSQNDPSAAGYVKNKPAVKTGGGESSVVLGQNGAAYAFSSVAQGSGIASGNSSHAEGMETLASGYAAHAEGIGTTASGKNSHAEGSSTESAGLASHAEGQGTQTKNSYEHAQGMFNKSNKVTDAVSGNNTLHSIGIGAGTSSRKNAVEVMQNGDVYMYGVGGYDGTNPSSASTLQEDISGKAAKANNPTANNLAGLDASGNLKDSGYAPGDFATAEQGAKADTAYQKPVSGIPSRDIESGVIPIVPAISTNIAADKASTTKTAAPSAVWNEVHPAVGSSQPPGGMLPNVMYSLGTLSGNTTFAMATASDNTIVNHWYWTFDTPSAAPAITWPAAITGWSGGSAPTIKANKHYEISVLGGVGTFMEA